MEQLRYIAQSSPKVVQIEPGTLYFGIGYEVKGGNGYLEITTNRDWNELSRSINYNASQIAKSPQGNEIFVPAQCIVDPDTKEGVIFVAINAPINAPTAHYSL